MREAVHDDLKAVKSELDELESLLMRCQTVQTSSIREITRFKKAHSELSEIFSDLSQSSQRSSNEVALISNFPNWASEAVQCFVTITSDLPEILQSMDEFDLDAMTARLAIMTCEPPGFVESPR